ncbi:MAG TPA: hypothetical protein VED41_07855, partial [Solirubrobacteraceae bacterium]|nr:hypothetical protein [Solirubrobacteraceae bacterium]
MSASHLATPIAQRASTAREPGRPGRRRRACAQRRLSEGDHRVLARYVDGAGCGREVVTRRGAAGSTLVIDRERSTHGDARLVAHIAADEPAENAALVCRRYLQDAAVGRGGCRPLNAEDANTAPFVVPWEPDASASALADAAGVVDRLGRSYALDLVHSRLSIPELRWCRCERNPKRGIELRGGPVSVREVIGSLESYEPVCTLTGRALSTHARDDEVSTTVLRAELARVQASPIVLNRGLREAVLSAVDVQELSMS